MTIARWGGCREGYVGVRGLAQFSKHRWWRESWIFASFKFDRFLYSLRVLSKGGGPFL